MSGSLALVGDVGGTNARFALVDPEAPAPRLLERRTLRNGDFDSLEVAVRRYLDQTGARPRRASLALACPLDGDEVRLTNCGWTFSRVQLQGALELDELMLLNDFGAVAHAIPVLAAGDQVALDGHAPRTLAGPVSVLGPGTGLGVALLVGTDGGWRVVDTEGGHAAFAPLDPEEQAICRWLAARHGRTSWERVLSGSGLACIDAVLRGVAPDAAATAIRHPADVTHAALEGHDVIARRALERFCAILGSIAGDIALVHGARTVMIAGGIVPRFIPFLQSSAFRTRFLDKGRFAAHLEPVSIRVVTHPDPGLLGAAVALRRRAGCGADPGARMPHQV